jgi:hypothetical protein
LKSSTSASISLTSRKVGSSSADLPSLTVSGHAIRTNPQNSDLISLTDLHRAAGGADNQRPYEWLRLPHTMAFMATVAEKLNTGPSHILETKRGRGVGGTYAHWQIALAYAKYLSPELHMAVNEVYMRYRSGDHTLANESG